MSPTSPIQDPSPSGLRRRALTLGVVGLMIALLLFAGYTGTAAQPLADLMSTTTTTEFAHSPSGQVAPVGDLPCEQRLSELELDSVSWPDTADVAALDQVYQDIGNIMLGVTGCPAAVQGAIRSIECRWLLTTPWVGDPTVGAGFRFLRSNCPI